MAGKEVEQIPDGLYAFPDDMAEFRDTRPCNMCSVLQNQGPKGTVRVCAVVKLSTGAPIAKPIEILSPEKLRDMAPYLDLKRISSRCPNGIKFVKDYFKFITPPTPEKIFIGNLSPDQQAVCTGGCLAIRFPSGIGGPLCIKALAHNPVETNLLQANAAVQRTDWKRINESIPDGCPNGYVPTPASED